MPIAFNHVGQPATRRELSLDAMAKVCRIWAMQIPAEHDSAATLDRVIRVVESHGREHAGSPMLLESLQALFCHVCNATHPGIAAVCKPDDPPNDCWLIGLLD